MEMGDNTKMTFSNTILKVTLIQVHLMYARY